MLTMKISSMWVLVMCMPLKKWSLSLNLACTACQALLALA